jgi:CheY-like chemotaxis protein
MMIFRELLSSMLESTGYLVDSAVDGEEALDKYISASNSDNTFDIVIMDLTIPGGMGGKEAVSKFIAIDSQVKAGISSGAA